MFCWQCLTDMTDAEKLSIIDDILAFRGVFVQSAGGHLKRQHKPGIKDMVMTRKVDRMMVRMLHYILFLETEEDAEVWRYGSLFFRTKGQLLAEFGPQGLTKQVWVELRKHFQGAVEYVKTCKRNLPLEKESLDDTKRMYEDDSFLKGMARLSVHHVRTGKWVRHAQRKATVREGNMLVEECDRLYVIFNGENLADNTVALFPTISPTKSPRAHGPSPGKHEVAARSKAVCSSDPSEQVVAYFGVADEDWFPRSQWEDGGVINVRGPAYGDRERNPSDLLGLLEKFCRVGQIVFFFGKAHASVVWELLRNVRDVVALEDKANMIDYLNEFVKTRAADPRNNCSFAKTTDERNWDPKRDIYWKLSGNKRMKVWDFLFQTGPPAQTDLEYNRRRNLVFGVLNGYHDAPRESVSNFLRKLDNVFFLMAEPLTLENYKAKFDEEDPFDAEDIEELSNSETFDFESMPLPRVVGQVGDEGEGGPRRYSTFPAGLKRVFERERVDDQSSDDGKEERDYDYEPCDKLPGDHDTEENDRLFFFDKHHRIFQPAVKNGKWVMTMKDADGKWSDMNRLGAGPFKKKARDALVEHLSLMNPERSFSDVTAYAGRKLYELYDDNMLEFRAPFYTLETTPSRGIDWRMPQPPSGDQHPGRGGGGDQGDGGGDGGDGSQFLGKGSGETSSGEKASGGKGSGGKGSGGKGSAGKGSGGKGSGWKGSGGKRRTSRSPQYRETDSHCVESQDSDMRDVATLRSSQHTAASPERRNFSLIGIASSFCLEGGMPALRTSEGATISSLTSGERHKLRIDSESLTSPWRPSARSAPHATVPRGQENVTSYPPHLQLGTGFPWSPPFSYGETRDWRFRDVLEGPAAGVLETGGGEYGRHASEGVPVDVESKSTAAPGKRSALREHMLYSGKTRLNTGSLAKGWRPGVTSVNVMLRRREEDTQHWPAREVVKGLDAGVLVIGTSEEILHSRSVVATTREGVVKEGQWTFVDARLLGDEEGEEEPVVEARVHGDEKGGEPVVGGAEVTVGIQMDPQRKNDDSSPTRCGEEQGDRAYVLSTGWEIVLHEATELGNDSAVTELVSDSGVAEVQNVESSVEGGEVAISIKMGPERKDHDSPSTRCGEEQGDRVSILSTGREMVLHEAIKLHSDSAATELVSNSAMAEVQNVESSVDVGAVARQEGDFPQRAPEHGKICE
ncbi:hypothetical protein CBR_g45354 [Chara braunii]|uniref:Uncharacterized protein n=1 Tax=Chara braunii TaxID=69332 RepID=A0A388LYE8_CHABU|nr:hypothetical protein CBR_g45354 [Chara braunii]|eukprot:GBG87295.1 hypothetical protein CBR_g45354 [Chara braunii]